MNLQVNPYEISTKPYCFMQDFEQEEQATTAKQEERGRWAEVEIGKLWSTDLL